MGAERVWKESVKSNERAPSLCQDGSGKTKPRFDGNDLNIQVATRKSRHRVLEKGELT